MQDSKLAGLQGPGAQAQEMKLACVLPAGSGEPVLLALKFAAIEASRSWLVAPAAIASKCWSGRSQPAMDKARSVSKG